MRCCEARTAIAGVLGLAAVCCSVVVREAMPAPEALARIDCVAVLPFEDLSGREGAGALIAAMVAEELMLSGYFNTLEPAELERLLDVQGISTVAASNPAVAQSYARALGVRGIIVGSVSSYSHEELSRKTNEAEPVVAFTAKLIDAETGDVLWSTAASNFDYQVLLAIPRPLGSLAKETVSAALDDLIDERNDYSVEQEVCWRPYWSYMDDAAAPAPAWSIATDAVPLPADAAKIAPLQVALGAGTIPPGQQRFVRQIQAGGTFVLEGIDFEGNHKLIKRSTYVLDDLGNALKLLPKRRIVISGHIHPGAPYPQLRADSLARANAVADYLIGQHGIAAARIGAEGLGDDKPLANSDATTRRERHNRIELTVQP